jgi:hypothetical protein
MQSDTCPHFSDYGNILPASFKERIPGRMKLCSAPVAFIVFLLLEAQIQRAL